jgi:hypothetical protein
MQEILSFWLLVACADGMRWAPLLLKRIVGFGGPVFGLAGSGWVRVSFCSTWHSFPWAGQVTTEHGTASHTVVTHTTDWAADDASILQYVCISQALKEIIITKMPPPPNGMAAQNRFLGINNVC